MKVLNQRLVDRIANTTFTSKIVLFVVLFVPLVWLTGCGSEIETNVRTGGPTVQQAITYHGPKARIAVASFKCKAAKCNGEIGSGLADMLSTALFRTGRFVVLERGEGLRAIQEELNLGQSGYVQQGKAPQKGLLEGADILVVGAITAFEPNASGIGGGGVVIPLKIPFLGGIAAKKKEAYIAADIRLIDVRTGRVINATTVEGKTSSWKLGGLGGTVIGSVALGGGLGVYRNTPMEKAVRVMIENAVNAIARMVPENYYRYSASGRPLKQTSSSYSSQNMASGQPAYGRIVGGSGRFVPGRKILLVENCSEYSIGQLPNRHFHIKGQAETAGFAGKKWIRALSDKVVLYRKINLPKNFALEWSVYFSGSYAGVCHCVYLGRLRNKWSKSEILFWASDWNYARWASRKIRTVKLRAGRIHHFAIQQKNGMLRIFIDGVKAYEEPVNGGIVGGKLPNRDAITFELGGANPSEHKEILITDIRLTAY